ncbi:hypothetical protein [Bacillus sp. FJAT-50079]|uniref:hypothetical protein n=1 Tax=Bacillus sp. FJAT-50079 TaxID=2833577 RepID=UPI001BC9BA96|nr:hypothetical protein [Bacillus sp. FJAT-50079]MBS4207493.1 hypothetical protein [Bacillus sp. FJAT-50079]
MNSNPSTKNGSLIEKLKLNNRAGYEESAPLAISSQLRAKALKELERIHLKKKISIPAEKRRDFARIAGHWN